MYLFDELCGMYHGGVEKALYIQNDFLIDFALTGEAIYLASEWPEGGREERMFFILVNMDTGRVTQIWEFPAGYRGMHPTMFME